MVTILMYHQIAHVLPENDPFKLSLAPEKFEWQMAYLQREGYQCLPLSEAVRLMREGRDPHKAVVLTFDDGFVDLYITVWPILEKYGFTATIFFVPAFAGRMSDWEGQSGPYAAQVMTWEQVKELFRSGVFAFGGHTLTHAALTQLTPEQARHELTESKRILEEQLSAPVEFFAYPFSLRSPAAQQWVAECGYQAACSGERGRWDFFNMWRAQCGTDETRLSFALKVRGWHTRKVWFREETVFGPPLRRAIRTTRRVLGRA